MIIDTLRELVSMPSFGGNEVLIADYLVAKLQSHKTHRVVVQNYAEGGRNVLILPPVPRIILDAHLDTVPPGNLENWTASPFALVEKQGQLIGLGALDDKVNIAIALELFETMDCHQVGFVFCGGEETAGDGLAFALKSGQIPAVELAIAMEPTNAQVITAHKGVGWVKLVFRGKATHASTPEKGENAIEKALRFGEYFLHHKSSLIKQHALLGSNSFNLGTINGGTVPNVVPERCEMQIDIRTLPGQIEADFGAMFEQLVKASGSEAEIVTEAFAPAMDYSGKSKWLNKLRDLSGKETSTVTFWSHSGFYEAAGIPSLVFGPGDIRSAHQPNEQIAVAEAERVLGIWREFFKYI